MKKSVIYGSYPSISSTSGDERIVSVKRYINHSKYISGGYQDNYDLCLLETDSMSLDGAVRDIICIPENKNHIHANDNLENGPSCFAAGWGLLKDETRQVNHTDTYLPDILQGSGC